MACSVILLTAITLVVASGAEAWESDVHYGLTYWLALQASFTDDAARLVAEADLSLDRGMPSRAYGRRRLRVPRRLRGIARREGQSLPHRRERPKSSRAT